MSILESVPTINKLVVYLDFNVFVDVMEVDSLKKKMNLILDKDFYYFPFTHIHIEEIKRIKGDNREAFVQKHLESIKKISKSKYFDFRKEINSFTIRDRDPFEVFETMNEIPESFINDVSKMATEQYMEGVIPNFPKDCYKMDDQYKFFTMMFRKEFPGLGSTLNSKTRNEAISYLESEVFKGYSFEQLYELLINNLKPSGSNANIFDLEFFIENTLYLAGYKTPNKDLKKTSGLLSDHQHLKYADNCALVISKDKNFRKKLKSKYSSNEKLVLDLEDGLNFLLVHSGVINLVSKDTGESMNKDFISSFTAKD